MESIQDVAIEPELFYDRHFEIAKNSFDKFLVKNQPPTLHGLLDREGLKEAELPSYFQGVVDSVCKDDRIYGKVPEIRFLYDTYLATQNINGRKSVLFDFSQSLTSFENFKDRFMSNATKLELSNIYDKITFFRGRVIHPSREITLFDDAAIQELADGIYLFSGRWVMLPEQRKRYAFTMVDRSTIIEALILKKRGLNSDIYHTTGSAALGGIEKAQAILSSGSAKKGGIDIITGEINTYITEDNRPQTTGELGNDEVFVTENGISKGYELTRWFDEYSVTFAAPLDKQRKYIEKTYGEDSTRFFWDSNGMTVGPEVPLSITTHMIVDHPNLNEAKAWAKKVAPHLIVTSYDAYLLWRKSSYPDRGFERLEDLLRLPSFNVDEKGKVT